MPRITHDCNVIVTKPINHMISAPRDQSHGLGIWPTNLILDIRLLRSIHIIITSMSWPHPCLSSVISILLHLNLLIIVACIFNEPRDLAWASSRVLWRLIRKTTSRLMLVLDPVVIAYEEFPRLRQGKTIDGSHKWSSKRNRWLNAAGPNLLGCQH